MICNYYHVILSFHYVFFLLWRNIVLSITCNYFTFASFIFGFQKNNFWNNLRMKNLEINYTEIFLYWLEITNKIFPSFYTN